MNSEFCKTKALQPLPIPLLQQGHGKRPDEWNTGISLNQEFSQKFHTLNAEARTNIYTEASTNEVKKQNKQKTPHKTKVALTLSITVFNFHLSAVAFETKSRNFTVPSAHSIILYSTFLFQHPSVDSAFSENLYCLKSIYINILYSSSVAKVL